MIYWVPIGAHKGRDTALVTNELNQREFEIKQTGFQIPAAYSSANTHKSLFLK